MSKSEIRVAKRYAKALFESCSAQNYEAVSLALNEIATSLKDNELKNALLNPGFSPEKRASWLSELSVKVCPAEASALGNLFGVIVRNRRVDCLPAIAEFFAVFHANYKKLLALEVTSAKELSGSEKEEFSQKVKSKLPSDIAAGVSFDWKTEKELLAGMQVRVGDKLLDGSVSGAINKIARQLRS